MGSYKVHIYSRSVSYRNHRSEPRSLQYKAERLGWSGSLLVQTEAALIADYGRKQIDYRYVLYMTPLQKIQTIPLTQQSSVAFHLIAAHYSFQVNARRYVRVWGKKWQNVMWIKTWIITSSPHLWTCFLPESRQINFHQQWWLFIN